MNVQCIEDKRWDSLTVKDFSTPLPRDVTLPTGQKALIHYRELSLDDGH